MFVNGYRSTETLVIRTDNVRISIPYASAKALQRALKNEIDYVEGLDTETTRQIPDTTTEVL